MFGEEFRDPFLRGRRPPFPIKSRANMLELETLQRLFLAWMKARDHRVSEGGLRVSPLEISTLEAFDQAKATLSPDAAAGWGPIRIQLERLVLTGLCRCGHPVTHHLENGEDCFHVVGCNTACSCDGFVSAQPDTASGES